MASVLLTDAILPILSLRSSPSSSSVTDLIFTVKHTRTTNYFAFGSYAKYCDQHVCVFVCLSVCPLAYLKNDALKFHLIFCTCFLRPCGMLRTFGFVDDVMFPYNGGNRPKSKTSMF